MFRVSVWLCAFGFTAYTVEMLRERHVGFSTRTIVSRTGRVPEDSEDAIILLQKAREVIPAGRTVVFIKPDRRSASDDSVTFFVALGQLPRHRVLAATALSANPPAEYVIGFRARFDDHRFRVVYESKEGTISRSP